MTPKSVRFLIFMLLFASTAFAQNAIQSNKAKIDSLFKISRTTIYNDPDSCIDVSKLALYIAESIKDSASMASAYKYIGIAYEIKTDYKQAVEYLDKCYALADKIDDKQNLAVVQINKGIIYLDLSQEDLAIKYFYNALSIANNPADSVNPSIKAACLNNIAVTYTRQDDYKSATEIYKQVVSQSVANKDTNSLELVYNNLTDAYIHLGQFDTAKIYLDSAFFMQEATKNRYNLSGKYISAYQYYKGLNDYVKAHESINKAIPVLKSFNDSLRLTELFNLEAELYEAEKNYTAGLASLDSSKNYFSSATSFNHLAQTHKKYGDLHKALSQFEKASENYNLAITYLDSTYEDLKQNNRIAGEIEAKTQHYKDEMALAKTKAKTLEYEGKITNYILIALTGGILFFTILIAILIANYRNRKQLIAQLTDKNKELHDNALVQQKLISVIGHDFKSPLTAIISMLNLVKTGDLSKEDLNDLASKATNNIELTLKNIENVHYWIQSHQGKQKASPKNISLLDLIYEIKQLHEFHFNSKQIVFKTRGLRNTTLFADETHANIIFRNLISNALKFTPEEGSITVAAEANPNNTITVHITDSGIGMSPEKVAEIQKGIAESTKGTAGEKGTGLGLQLVNEYIRLNKGKLEIQSDQKNGTSVIVTLPRGN